MSGKGTRKNLPERDEATLSANIIRRKTLKRSGVGSFRRSDGALLSANVAEWARRFPGMIEPAPDATAAPAPESSKPCTRGRFRSGPDSRLCDGWYVIPESRRAVWAAAFPNSLQTCWQDRNNTTLDKKDLIKDYIGCLMRIDELRQAALLFAYKKFGIDPAVLTGPERITKILEKASEINADTTLREYLTDVEYLISFPQPTEVEKVLLANTKEKLLREEPLRNMVYPWRLSNLQIRLLAENFTYLKSNDTDLKRLATLKQQGSPSFDTALEITAGHLMSEAYELSYKLTGDEPIDGIFMYDHIGTYKKTFKTFYETMLRSIVDNISQFNAEACKQLFFSKEDDLITTAARAAASIFLLYKNTPAWTYDVLLTQFKDPAGRDCRLNLAAKSEEAVARLQKHLPTREVWGTPIIVGVSLDTLLGQLNPDLMQFVLQLAYRLQFPDAGGPTMKQESVA